MENSAEYFDFIKRKLQQTEALLSVKQFHIETLGTVSNTANQNIPPQALYKMYEYILRSQLNIGKLLLFVYEDYWYPACYFNVAEEAIKMDPETLFFANDLYAVNSGNDKLLQEFEIVLPLHHKGKALAYLLLGDIIKQDIEGREEKINFIRTITNIIVVSSENRRLIQQQLQKQLIERELSMAVEVQSMLIPQNPPSDERIDVSGIYFPHKEIGGDYYDVIEISKDEIALTICDVSGKGVSAGMLMANFQANLRLLVIRDLPLDEIVNQLNQRLYDVTKGEKHITLFIAIYNFKSRTLRYVNAGHNPSILRNKGKVEELSAGCTILGIFDELPVVKVGILDIQPGAILFNYTDGLVEFESKDDRSFGAEQLKEFVESHTDQSMQLFNTSLLGLVHDYKGDKPFLDDISVLSCRFL